MSPAPLKAGLTYTCGMVNHIAEDGIGRYLKRIKKDDQLLATRKRCSTLKSGDVVCREAGLLRKLFLRQSKTLSALLDSLAYSCINHDIYHVPFYIVYNNYMDKRHSYTETLMHRLWISD